MYNQKMDRPVGGSLPTEMLPLTGRKPTLQELALRLQSLLYGINGLSATIDGKLFGFNLCDDCCMKASEPISVESILEQCLLTGEEAQACLRRIAEAVAE